jgi:hypothetical protein
MVLLVMILKREIIEIKSEIFLGNCCMSRWGKLLKLLVLLK